MGRPGYCILLRPVLRGDQRSPARRQVRTQLQRYCPLHHHSLERCVPTAARSVVFCLCVLRRPSTLPTDTLIVWTEPDGVDYALSFQDPDGCLEVWQFILEVQRHMNSTGSWCFGYSAYVYIDTQQITCRVWPHPLCLVLTPPSQQQASSAQATFLNHSSESLVKLRERSRSSHEQHS